MGNANAKAGFRCVSWGWGGHRWGRVGVGGGGAEEVGGGDSLGRSLFRLPRERKPWFPGTMQQMRASPRKIRL